MTSGGSKLAPTASMTTGPFFPAQFIRSEDNDLTRVRAEGPAARGQVISLTGTVTDINGAPAVNAILELWQPDADGNFAGSGKADPNFRGWGRTWTDKSGQYRFLTIKPGSIAAGDRRNAQRPPYINVMVLGSGIMRPLVTQIFFPGEPLNDQDPQLSLVPAEHRGRLVAKPATDAAMPNGAIALRFDIRLAGADETPFFED